MGSNNAAALDRFAGALLDAARAPAGAGAMPPLPAECADETAFLESARAACSLRSGTDGAAPTGSLGRCLNAVTLSTCAQARCLAAAAEQAAGLSRTDTCAAARGLVDSLASPGAAEQAANALVWYSNVAAPCLAETCADTPTPVTAAELQSVPRAFARNLGWALMSPYERFLSRYGAPIAGVVFLLLVGLVVWLAIRSRTLARRLADLEAVYRVSPIVASTV
jgi:hypothetical protein